MHSVISKHANELDFLVKLKFQSSTIMSSVIKYSVHDLLCDINNCV